MKLPISWLRDWVEFDGTPEAVAEALTTRGFYVEGLETLGVPHPGVVVARVLEAGRHPNADKLKLCRVDAGAGGEPLRIVCGAPNVTAGMLVPLATLGTTMPGGLVIKAAKIRGEESQGMLCSARELQLGEDHGGIVDLERLLPGHALALGSALDDHLPPPDAVLEVEVPFNRPDGLGIVGLAREVKAALGGRWTQAARARHAARHAAPAGPAFALTIADPDACPAFVAQVVHGVRVEPSPPWLVSRLAAMGQRSINNLVDLTNLILFEFGQPVHAYDLARIGGPALSVRRAQAGESIVTLDGVTRALTPESLLITDAARPVGIAGVMGGADSEVGAGTTELLLECANFSPRVVRRSSKALALATEAAKRYERGVDPALGPVAAARFVSLLLELCPGARLGPGVVVAPDASARVVTLRPARATRLVGLPFDAGTCEPLLAALEFGVERQGDALRVSVPGWRSDVTLEDDLVEEVARSHGYDRIPDAAIETRGARATRTARERAVTRARDAMQARGFTEAWCSSMVSEKEALAAAALLGTAPGALVRLANPMSREGEILRPNLIAGLLRATAHNLRQGARAVRLYEVGAGVAWGDPRGPLPEETLMLAAVVTGPRLAHAHDPAPPALDFAEAKGLWEAWLEQMRVDGAAWRAYSAPGWKPGAAAEVVAQASRIAWAGALAGSLLEGWQIDTDVHLFVAHLEPLVAAATGTRRATLPGRFPPVRRDVAFFAPRSVTHADLERALRGAAGDLLRWVELFDVYEGPGTPPGQRSLAYALEFQHDERTLTESEIAELQARMVTAVARDCGGQLRERT